MKPPLHRHRAFYIAAGAGVTAALAGFFLDPKLAVTLGANAFFLVYLVLSLSGVPKLTAAYLKRNAERADEPVTVIFLVTLATVVVALASLFLLVNQKESPDLLVLALTLAAVPLGWFTIHTMAALHYAHLYWQPHSASETRGRTKSLAGGLDFPGTKEPCGMEFLYFAYVIGMTAQTSDIAVTTTQMRTASLVHSVIAFFFNTVLVAAAVNAAVSLGS